jgi:hypothetical protein
MSVTEHPKLPNKTVRMTEIKPMLRNLISDWKTKRSLRRDRNKNKSLNLKPNPEGTIWRYC